MKRADFPSEKAWFIFNKLPEADDEVYDEEGNLIGYIDENDDFWENPG